MSEILVEYTDNPVEITVESLSVDGIVVVQALELVDLSYEEITLNITQEVVTLDRGTGITIVPEQVSVQLYMQDEQPVDSGQYLWIQTNMSGNPDDFTIWFNDTP